MGKWHRPSIQSITITNDDITGREERLIDLLVQAALEWRYADREERQSREAQENAANLRAAIMMALGMFTDPRGFEEMFEMAQLFGLSPDDEIPPE